MSTQTDSWKFLDGEARAKFAGNVLWRAPATSVSMIGDGFILKFQEGEERAKFAGNVLWITPLLYTMIGGGFISKKFRKYL